MMFTINLIKDWRASLLLVVLIIFTQGSIETSTLSSSITPTESSRINEVACSIQNRPATLTADTVSFLNLQSPGFPRSHPNSANCQWLITATYGYGILLQNVYVDLERGADHLYVYNDRTDNPRSFICDVGINCTLDIYISGNSLFLKFTSDSSVTKTGFSLWFKAIINTLPGTVSTPVYGNTAGSKCILNSRPEVVRANPDVLTTIQFPNTDKMTCQLLIETWPGYVVHLEMTNTNFSNNLYCYNLEFYDGNTADYRSLGSMCGTYSQYKSSTESCMLVRFNPQSSIGGTRLIFKVKAVLKPITTQSIVDRASETNFSCVTKGTDRSSDEVNLPQMTTTNSNDNCKKSTMCCTVAAVLSTVAPFLLMTLIIMFCLYKRRCRSSAARHQAQSSAAAASRCDVYTIPQHTARTQAVHTTNGVQNQVPAISNTLTMSVHAFRASSAREEQSSGTPSACKIQITTGMVQNSDTQPDTATPPPPYSEVALWQ